MKTFKTHNETIKKIDVDEYIKDIRISILDRNYSREDIISYVANSFGASHISQNIEQRDKDLTSLKQKDKFIYEIETIKTAIEINSLFLDFLIQNPPPREFEIVSGFKEMKQKYKNQ